MATHLNKGKTVNNSINFRDCGGYPINDSSRMKQGVLFRSGSLDRVRGKNLRRVRAASLGTMIDLRPNEERSRKIVQFAGVDRITIPFDVDRISRERIAPYINRRDGIQHIISETDAVYRDMVSLAAAGVHDLFSVLISARYPLCINCRAGKDRTGFAVALIHMALGVSVDDMIVDYLETNRFFLSRVRRMTRPLTLLSLGRFPARTWEAALTARESSLRAVIQTIENDHGGIEGYLDHCGIGKDKRARLRELLCEPV